MKKVVSIVLGIFISILLCGAGNVLFAQNDNPKNTNSVTTEGTNNSTNDVGINLSGSCLDGIGKGCFDYEKMIGISKMQTQDYTAKSVAQDVILSATYMVGTVLTIVIIYCGLMYIFSARGGKDTNNYRRGLVNAAIGALLVRGAYAIVRLIQYIAKG